MTAIPLEEMGILPEQDWRRLAEMVTGNPDDSDSLKQHYKQQLASHLEAPGPVLREEPEARPLPETAFYAGEPFEINKTFNVTIVPLVLALSVTVAASGGKDWQANVHVAAEVFGKDAGGSSFKLSRLSSYIEIHPGILVAKADLKIGLYGEKLCFGVEGQACYWLFGWHCTPINAPSLFCLVS